MSNCWSHYHTRGRFKWLGEALNNSWACNRVELWKLNLHLHHWADYVAYTKKGWLKTLIWGFGRKKSGEPHTANWRFDQIFDNVFPPLSWIKLQFNVLTLSCAPSLISLQAETNSRLLWWLFLVLVFLCSALSLCQDLFLPQVCMYWTPGMLWNWLLSPAANGRGLSNRATVWERVLDLTSSDR